MTFGQKLKELRVKCDLTQKDLADQLHVTYQTVSKWENNTNEPDLATLKELAKILNCSIEELLSESNEQVQKEKPAESKLPICEHCHKEIQEHDLVKFATHSYSKVGRRTTSHITGYLYYHKECYAEVEEYNRKLEIQRRITRKKRAIKLSYIWSTIGGVLALGISLGIFLGAVPTMPIYLSIILSIVIGYAIFADLYCIISGSYIGNVFLSVSGWSIKFPGLIFTWDLGGFVWLIGMKILFGILGFLFGIFVLALAIVLSAALSVVSFPFVLIHNIRTGYVDSLAYEDR